MMETRDASRRVEEPEAEERRSCDNDNVSESLLACVVLVLVYNGQVRRSQGNWKTLSDIQRVKSCDSG